MKALILRGKKKGKVIIISQWCNDWFSTEDNDIFSPSALGFKIEDMKTIEEHEGNGMLFNYYQVTSTKPECGEFFYTFKKRKYD